MAPTLSPRSRQRGFWQYLIPAAVGLVGSIFSSRNAQQGQEKANETNVELAREQMQFQEEMSSTAYQRGTADMKAAGLNPMLAYAQGGASAPQGQTARVDSATALSSQQIGSSAAQAAQIMGAYQQAQATEANRALIEAQTRKTQSETMSHDLNSAQRIADLDIAMTAADKGRADTTVSQQTHRNLEAAFAGIAANSAADVERYNEAKTRGGFSADVERRKEDARRARYEADISKYGINEAKSTSDFFEKTGQAPKWLQTILSIIRATK